MHVIVQGTISAFNLRDFTPEGHDGEPTFARFSGEAGERVGAAGRVPLGQSN